MKKCSVCGVNKGLDEYHKRSNRPCGVRSICKDCYKKYPSDKKRKEGYMRNYDLKKSYGIDVNEYQRIYDLQDGRCAICEKKNIEVAKNHKKNLSVDHCHASGKIRGLLCDSCNRGLGLLGDDAINLFRAFLYLTR